jgi:hypothetical protein
MRDEAEGNWGLFGTGLGRLRGGRRRLGRRNLAGGGLRSGLVAWELDGYRHCKRVQKLRVLAVGCYVVGGDVRERTTNRGL